MFTSPRADAPAENSPLQALTKVPEVTLGFWLIKIAATTLGETGGDALSMSMNLGYLLSTGIFAVAFALFVWAQIPEAFRHMGSVEFAKLLVREAKVAVSPGLGFGPYGDDHVRFALIENALRTKQAIKGIKKALAAGGDCQSE